MNFTFYNWTIHSLKDYQRNISYNISKIFFHKILLRFFTIIPHREIYSTQIGTKIFHPINKSLRIILFNFKIFKCITQKYFIIIFIIEFFFKSYYQRIFLKYIIYIMKYIILWKILLILSFSTSFYKIHLLLIRTKIFHSFVHECICRAFSFLSLVLSYHYYLHSAVSNLSKRYSDILR